MYKKLFALLLALVLTLSVVTAASAAVNTAPVAEDDDFDDDDDAYVEYSADGTLKFRVTDSDPYEAFLMSYTGSATSVVIPSEVNGYKVTGIRNGAFAGNPNSSKITSITLPENLDNAASSFEEIPNVKTINVPAKLGYFTFDRESIKKTAWFKNLPSGVVYLGRMAIGYKGTVPAKLTIKAGTTAIYENAFADKTAIKSLSLPNGLTRIGETAFVGCVNLKDVVVPATVKEIGAGAIGYKEYYWKDVYYEEYEDSDWVLFESKIPGFIMYVAKNSPAHKYAKNNGIKYAYTVNVPQIIKFQNVNGGTTLTWNKNANAKYYRVFGMSSNGWQTICSKTAANCFTYKYKTPVSGKYYYYTVRALSANGNVYISGYNSTGWKYMYIAPPANPKLTNTKNGVSVRWAKPKGATYCRLFRKTGSGSWVKIADTNKLSYVDKTAKKGVTYTYTLRVINKAGTKFFSGFKAGTSIKRK